MNSYRCIDIISTFCQSNSNFVLWGNGGCFRTFIRTPGIYKKASSDAFNDLKKFLV
ncbi:hypothetical protein KTT_03490 [Tengunoibacter tsumagoiensis]|uniref:Uncharacterized protein n=1 Tax=Tengunoibacter tsumagoiensis TaxID=2014871 RepID=A0A401ZUT2_9CHLR|nr:hypothetical protein KTT_03490 [Tengunoibacter tsumagoiensis]